MSFVVRLMLAALACSATALQEVTYIGWDHVLLHQPSTGAYSINHYARYSRPPCVGLAGEPTFVGSVGVVGQRFIALGKGALLQVDPATGRSALRQCGGADRLPLGLRVACPVVFEGPPQRAWANVSFLAPSDDLLLVHNTSRMQSASLRGYRIPRAADGVTLASAARGFDKLPLAGLVWRERFGQHALAALGKGLVLDYEPASPAHFRIWRLNPKCASGTPCNSATDPPLQGPMHEGQFPHAGRSFVGLSTDAPADVSVVHVLELEPASASYRVLVCDVAKLGLHLPLPCSYYQPSTPLLQPSPCTSFASSATCLAVEGCGWCASSSTCLLGHEIGPCSATCPKAAWAGIAHNASARSATPRALSQPGDGASAAAPRDLRVPESAESLGGGGGARAGLVAAAALGSSELAISSTLGFGAGSLVKLSAGTAAEEEHVVGRVDVESGRLQLLGSTGHRQPQGASVELLISGDDTTSQPGPGLATAEGAGAGAGAGAGGAGAGAVGAVEELVYLGGDSMLQLLPHGRYSLWRLAPPAESRAPSGTRHAPLRAAFDEAPTAQGLLPRPRLDTPDGAQLVYTGAASCGGVTDDGCDTFLEFERRSGRYFRFQRRPVSPPLAAAGVGGAYALAAQGVWPLLAGVSTQLLYVGHNLLWSWASERGHLRAFRYRSHRLSSAGPTAGAASAAGGAAASADAAAGEVGGVGEAVAFAGAWRLPAELRGQALAFVRSSAEEGLVVAYDAHAPAPVEATVWLLSPHTEDGEPPLSPLQRPELLRLTLWSAAPRQLVGLHSGMLLEYSRSHVISGQPMASASNASAAAAAAAAAAASSAPKPYAYTLHGLATDGRTMIAVGKGRLGGPIGGDARVCAHEERLSCVRDLRCGWCHSNARCLLAPTAPPASGGDAALGADSDESCPEPTSLELAPPAALAWGGSAPRIGWRPEHELHMLSPTTLLQWSPLDGGYQLWGLELNDVGTCSALLPLATGQWARAGVSLLPLDVPLDGHAVGGAAGPATAAPAEPVQPQLLLEHHRSRGTYRLLARDVALPNATATATTAAAAAPHLTARLLGQRALPSPNLDRALISLGGGALLDLHTASGGYRLWAVCTPCALAGHDPLPPASLLYETNASGLRGGTVVSLGEDELLVTYAATASTDAKHHARPAAFWRYVRPRGVRTDSYLPLQPSLRAPPNVGAVADPSVVGLPGGHLLVVDGGTGEFQLQRCAPPSDVQLAVPVEGAAAQLAEPPLPVCTPLGPEGSGSFHSPPCDYSHHDACLADVGCGWCPASSRCLPGDAAAPCSSALTTERCGKWEHQQRDQQRPLGAAASAPLPAAPLPTPSAV